MVQQVGTARRRVGAHGVRPVAGRSVSIIRVTPRVVHDETEHMIERVG